MAKLDGGACPDWPPGSAPATVMSYHTRGSRPHAAGCRLIVSGLQELPKFFQVILKLRKKT